MVAPTNTNEERRNWNMANTVEPAIKADRLAELKSRAERAQKLADDIAMLQEADPYRSGARITFKDYNTSTDYLDGELLKLVVAEGRKQILAAKEAELEGLLGNEPGEGEANAEGN